LLIWPISFRVNYLIPSVACSYYSSCACCRGDSCSGSLKTGDVAIYIDFITMFSSWNKFIITSLNGVTTFEGQLNILSNPLVTGCAQIFLTYCDFCNVWVFDYPLTDRKTLRFAGHIIPWPAVVHDRSAVFISIVVVGFVVTPPLISSIGKDFWAIGPHPLTFIYGIVSSEPWYLIDISNKLSVFISLLFSENWSEFCSLVVAECRCIPPAHQVVSRRSEVESWFEEWFFFFFLFV